MTVDEVIAGFGGRTHVGAFLYGFGCAQKVVGTFALVTVLLQGEGVGRGAELVEVVVVGIPSFDAVCGRGMFVIAPVIC
jgi:hypothetical protein